MSGKYDLDLLAHKVGWEGGVLDTIEYGIRAEDIEDSEVSALWADVESHYKAMSEPLRKIDLLLRQRRGKAAS